MYYLTQNGGGYSEDDTLPEGAVECTEAQATSGYHRLVNGVITTTVDILQLTKDEKIRQLKDDCQATLLSGFFSSALGENHEYGSNDTDQRNLLALSLAGNGGMIYCAKDSNWVLTEHTAKQVKTVLAEWQTYLQINQVKLVDLIKQVNNSDDVAKVEWV